MRRFLAPDAPRLILFAVFLIIAGMGAMQSAGFTDRGEAAFPTVPAWTVWMFLLLPLAAFAAQPAIVFWTAQIIYFYLLACAAVVLARAIVRKVRGRRSGPA